MAPADNRFPEDQGTGTSDGDHAGAATLAQAIFDPSLKDVIVKGLEFQNIENGTFDVTFGVAKVYVPSLETKDYGNGSEFRDECLITQQVRRRDGLEYVGTGTTHVFLDLDLTSDDRVTIVRNGDDTKPSDPSLKLGTIDESTDYPTYVNRKQTGDFKQLSVEDLTVSTAPDADSDAARQADLLDLQDGSGNSVESAVQTLVAGSDLRWTDVGGGSATLNAQGGMTTADKQNLTTHPIGMSELASGDWIDLPIRVPNGRTAKVWKWGTRTESQTTPSGLIVGLYDYDANAYINSASTAYSVSNPLASHAGAGDLAVRLENKTSGSLNAGADFSVTIE